MSPAADVAKPMSRAMVQRRVEDGVDAGQEAELGAGDVGGGVEVDEPAEEGLATALMAMMAATTAGGVRRELGVGVAACMSCVLRCIRRTGVLWR